MFKGQELQVLPKLIWNIIKNQRSDLKGHRRDLKSDLRGLKKDLNEKMQKNSLE